MENQNWENEKSFLREQAVNALQKGLDYMASAILSTLIVKRRIREEKQAVELSNLYVSEDGSMYYAREISNENN